MTPDELESVVAKTPIAFVPLGTFEHHGWHLPVCFDGINAHVLCERTAARTGGVVLPTFFYGTGGGHVGYKWNSRSMASYGLFTAICGVEQHGPRGYLAFSPRLTPDNFRSAFATAKGWGTFAQQRERASQTATLALKWGTLRLSTLGFDLPTGSRAAQGQVVGPNGPAPVAIHQTGCRVFLSLDESLDIKAGDTVQVTMHWDSHNS